MGPERTRLETKGYRCGAGSKRGSRESTAPAEGESRKWKPSMLIFLKE